MKYLVVNEKTKIGYSVFSYGIPCCVAHSLLDFLSDTEYHIF